MRKGRPATLTSSLLARKGEAAPAGLADGSNPKDVIALQEELVARVAAGISRSPSSGESGADGEPLELHDSVETGLSAGGADATAAEAPSIETAQSADDELGSAPAELPPGSADEPYFDPDAEARVAKDSQVTLADWTVRAQSGDTPFAYERMSESEPKERSSLLPLALGTAVVAVLATVAIWQASDRIPGVAASDSAPPAQTASAPAPAAIEPTPPAPASTAIAAPLSEVSAAPREAEPTPPSVAEAPKDVVAAEPAPARPAAAPLVGPYTIQLVSTASQSTAELAWTKVEHKITALGIKQPHAIQAADLGGKTRYRVTLPGFASATAAEKTCRILRANKLGCLVMKQG